jgi:hypothetical protein
MSSGNSVARLEERALGAVGSLPTADAPPNQRGNSTRTAIGCNELALRPFFRKYNTIA